VKSNVAAVENKTSGWEVAAEQDQLPHLLRKVCRNSAEVTCG